MKRLDAVFKSSKAHCAAWIYIPDGQPPYPCVILAHGFGATRFSRLDAYAERFAQAGLAAVVFDYQHFGTSEGEPRQLLDIRTQLEDWKAAIAYTRALPIIDPQRIALWGASLSGGYVIEIAAHEEGITAVVALVPFMDGFAVRNTANIHTTLLLAVAGIRDRWRHLLKKAPYYIKIVGAPGTVAVMTSPGAEAGVQAMTPVEFRQQNSVAARVLLDILFYRPIKSVPHVQCPLLICACTRDVIVPPEMAAKAARLGGRCELRWYDSSHFDIFVGEVFEHAVGDQLDFLTRHLLHVKDMNHNYEKQLL